mgnify:CR=1 FL=1
MEGESNKGFSWDSSDIGSIAQLIIVFCENLRTINDLKLEQIIKKNTLLGCPTGIPTCTDYNYHRYHTTFKKKYQLDTATYRRWKQK